LKSRNITDNRCRGRSTGNMSWLWFSCLALLFLLPPVSFAQSHLWQYRPFRANDTDHSGGDHICDLRRDSDADGKPDRLGSFVSVSGCVIAEPFTFEPAGRLFWIREGGCGILVYGEPEDLRLGDSVIVRGRVRRSRGDLVCPETARTDPGDAVLRKYGAVVRCGTGEQNPLPVTPEDYGASPAGYAGNLIALTRPVKMARTFGVGGNVFGRASCGSDSLTVYIDDEVACPIAPGRCYLVAGVVMGIPMPREAGTPAPWCIAPRYPTDLVEVGCSSTTRPLSWGDIKMEYRP
jgi:hypothetical protein